jgi:hypothetical protein
MPMTGKVTAVFAFPALCAAALLLFSCTQQTPATTAAAPQAAPAATLEPAPRVALPVISTTTELRDAKDALLGYVVSSSEDGLEVYTPKDYLVSLSWAGTPRDGLALYTEPAGAGTVFVQWSNAYPLQGYVTVIKGTPYIAATLNAEGNAVADPDITSYQSYYFDGAVTDIPSTPVLGSYGAFPLQKAGLADIGVPSSVSLPLKAVSRPE